MVVDAAIVRAYVGQSQPPGDVRGCRLEPIAGGDAIAFTPPVFRFRTSRPSRVTSSWTMIAQVVVERVSASTSTSLSVTELAVFVNLTEPLIVARSLGALQAAVA